MILLVFFLGMIIVLPVLLFEYTLDFYLKILPGFLYFVFLIIGISFIEEVFKYLAVRWSVLKNKEFDEPIDAMLYLIIAALGFAAVENLIVIFPLSAVHAVSFGESLWLSFFRFVGATLLHTLSSGIVGYFLALSFLKTYSRAGLLLIGIFLASIFHTLYNFGIARIEDGPMAGILVALLLLTGAIVLAYLFKRLKSMPSICK